MPRISNLFLDCVVYLYPDEATARAGEAIGGSGFLVVVPFKGNPGKGVVFAVTNRHVIDGGATAVRLNRKSGKPDVIDPDPRAWIFHPDGDDIAVTPVALNAEQHRYSTLNLDRDFVTKGLINQRNIGIGDEVFVVGRFISHEGQQRNLPSARFGNIAQMPFEPIVRDDGFEQETFLMEARSIGGYSGSPVFVFVEPFAPRADKTEDMYPGAAPFPGWVEAEKFTQLVQNLGPWLIGIDWCHLNDWKPVCGHDCKPLGRPFPENMQVASNTGMMGVIPAWKIAEVFEVPDIVNWMRAQEEMSKKDATPQKVTLDSVPKRATEIESEPSDSNPEHREAFNHLLGAAAKTKRSDG